MKKLSTILTLAALMCVALAQGQTSTFAIVWDPVTRSTAQVAGTQVGSLKRFAGLRYDVPVIAFAGLGELSRPVGGFALAPEFKLAENAAFQIGPAIFVKSGKPSGVSLFAGLSWKF